MQDGSCAMLSRSDLLNQAATASRLGKRPGCLFDLDEDAAGAWRAMVLGPIQVGLDRAVQIVPLSATDADLVNMAAPAAFDIGGWDRHKKSSRRLAAERIYRFKRVTSAGGLASVARAVGRVAELLLVAGALGIAGIRIAMVVRVVATHHPLMLRGAVMARVGMMVVVVVALVVTVARCLDRIAGDRTGMRYGRRSSCRHRSEHAGAE